MNRRWVVLIAAMGLSNLGCWPGSATLTGASRLQLDDARSDDALAAAEATMREFFTVETVDRRAGIVRSSPTRATDDRSGLFGPTISTPRSLRRIAELQVQPGRTGIQVSCRVRIERAEAVETAVRRTTHTLQDTPNQTPLEESQGLDAGTGVVWVVVGQDHRLEHAVLAALAERLAVPTP